MDPVLTEIERKNGAVHSVAGKPKDRRIRILFMIDHVHGFGGTEKHLYHLVQYLDKERFSCYLMVMDGLPSVLHLYEEKGCRVLPFSLHKIYDRTAVRVARELIRFLKDERIDIVQTFHFGSDTFGSIVSRLARVPVLISGRRDLGSYRTGYIKLIDRMTYPLFHRYLSVCRAVSDTLVAEGIPREKIHEIPNGVDLSNWPVPDERAKLAVRKKLNIAPDVFVIGNLSHFRPEKGHETFFEAIRRISSRIPKLKVFCLGAGKQRIQHSIQQDPLLRRIVTTDKVADVRDFLPAFDIACLTPTLNEGFSNALIEEMAAGLPVIATDVGGNREAVVDGVTGYIVQPGDDAAIAERMMKLYLSSKLRRTLGAQARRRVETEFSLEKMVSALQVQYQDLYSHHHRSQSAARLRLENVN